MPRRSSPIPDREAARAALQRLWKETLLAQSIAAPGRLSALVNSDQVAIRFCLPTQLLGKLVAPELDALCLQRGDGGPGQWDPRGFAARVVVPWNQENQEVLGRSGDPYVSNPLRRPRLDFALAQMSDRAQWESLCGVLNAVQKADDPSNTEHVLREVLAAIHIRLRELTFTYAVPARISLKQATNLVADFLAEGSGGDRGLAVVAALLEAFAAHTGHFKEVRRNAINASDAATRAARDLECIDANGLVALAVEVKERRLRPADVALALGKARNLGIHEVLLCTHGISPGDRDAIEAAFAAAWSSGTSLYHATVSDLASIALPLLGSAAIRQFIVGIGSQLDRFSTQPRHRTRWRDLLAAL